MIAFGLRSAFVVALGSAAFASTHEVFPNAQRSFLGAKPVATAVTSDHVEGILVLKFAHGTNARLSEGRFSPLLPELVAVDTQLQAWGASRHRIWLQDDAELVAWRLSGEARSQKPLHDLTQFFHVRLPDGISTSSVGCAASISTNDPTNQPVSGAGGYSVTASDVHSLKNGLLFGGVSGPAAIPFNGGTLCVNPPTKRSPIIGSGGTQFNNCTGT